MEEILASIRRIISEDDAPADTGEATPPAATEPAEAPVALAEPEAEPEPMREPEPEPHHAADLDDEVLELTERFEPPAHEPEPEPQLEEFDAIGDIAAVAPRPAPTPAPVFDEPESDEGLVSAPAAQVASSSFIQLARTVSMPVEGRVLEDVVRDLLRPLLKEWLDKNLPEIVEAQVRAEVERISRRR
jgi:hypothetical protein